MDTSKLILNPARLRILQFIRLRGSVKTSEITVFLNDVPRATVYHHVRLLEENGLIRVIAENRVRGACEKIYALEDERGLSEDHITASLSTAFYAGLMQEMNEYLSGQDHDCRRDRVLFSTGLLYMSDEEYDRLLENIGSLLKPFAGRPPEAGLKLRKLSIISSPPGRLNETGKKVKKGKGKQKK